MKRHSIALPALIVLAQGACGEEKALLHLERTLPLTGVEGRIDHLAVDQKHKRLYVAALGNNSLEVLDTETGRRIRSVKGLPEPQGIAFVAESGRLFVACGGDGTCRIYQTSPWTEKGTIDLGDDADNVRYDPRATRVYVGYGDGALAVIDAEKDAELGRVPLRGHPESFQLETEGPRLFVNVPDARQIAVIDREHRKVTDTWHVEEARANYPMALDEKHDRLFVGCRRPARLLVLDTRSGRQVANLDACGDADDIFYDDASQRIYVAGGEGFIDVFARRRGDDYQRVAHIPTADGARTALFVPEWHCLFLAVPHRGNQPAEVRVYKVNESINTSSQPPQ